MQLSLRYHTRHKGRIFVFFFFKLTVIMLIGHFVYHRFNVKRLPLLSTPCICVFHLILKEHNQYLAKHGQTAVQHNYTFYIIVNKLHVAVSFKHRQAFFFKTFLKNKCKSVNMNIHLLVRS